MKQLQLKVSGMDCANCELRLETALSHVEGVVRSKADYKEGSVSLVIDPAKVTEDSIRTSIRTTGFEVS